MKIALVVHDLSEHLGHGLYTRILADELAHRHTVSVFANRIESPGSASWHFQPVGAWRASALTSVKTFPLGLRRLAKTLEDYDVRHMQGYCGGRPNVVTAHICVAAYLDALHGARFRNRASLLVMASAEKKFYRHYEGRIVAISRIVADDLRERYGVRGPINLIHHGVDTLRFNSANRELFRRTVRGEIGVKEDETLALYVGDLTKAHVYLKALAKAAPAVRLAIVSRSLSYGWDASNVLFLPPTTMIERYYAAADAFVFPSTYDAFGLVVLEAMASGLAVFCSDRAGACELIETGINGCVSSLDDWVEETATGLYDRDGLKAIGAAAEHSARKQTWKSVVREIEHIYFNVVATDNVSESTAPLKIVHG